METSRWWNAETVAVVTGGNTGVGFEVCKQLAEKGLKVILTARNETQGCTAVETLKEQGLLNIVYHQLDVQDEPSIDTFASWLLQEQGGLDILINNAAVSGINVDVEYITENNIDVEDMMLNVEPSKGFIINYELEKSCIDTNYYGVKRVTKALIPLFRHSVGNARIVNVGSSYGQLSHLPNVELRSKLDDITNLSEGYIDDLLDTYLDDVKSKNMEHNKWPLNLPTYKLSKMALHAYTRILARDQEKMPPSQKIFVNCLHPGYVQSGFVKVKRDSPLGKITPKEGAENVITIALFPPQGCPSGKFFSQKKLSNF